MEAIEAAIEAEVAKRLRDAVTGAFGTSSPGVAARGASPRKRRRGLSPKRRRAQKLQGRYLGALRALGRRDRMRVKAVALIKGVAEAVKLAARLKKP